MSFGGFGSGGGFGSSQNQSSNTGGFGGFGATSNSNTSGGFGSTSTNGGLFGTNNSSTQSNPFSGGFGSGTSGGGFGSNNTSGGNSLFGGNKTGFGASSGGGLFGNNTTTSSAPSGGTAFGSFGSNNSSGGFGSSNTGNSLFTGNKPGFGAAATNNTTSSPFGGSGFGSSSSTNAFGSGTALGGQVPPSEGTGVVPFSPHIDKEGTGTQQVTNHFQTITMQQPYQKYSQEELRLADYGKNQRYGPGAGFGQSGSFGGFNNTASFGAQNANPFGGTSGTSGFGGQTSTTGGAFGSSGGSGGGGLFGANKPAGGNLFGTPNTGASSGGLFGAAPNNTSSSFSFGNTNAATSSNTGGLFGNQQQNNQQKPGGLFGTNTANTAGTNSLFGGGASQTSGAGGGGLFGGTSNNTSAGGGLFGGQPNSSNQTSGFGFGQQNQNQQSKPLFGAVGQNNNQPSGGLFGSNTNTSNTGGGGLFGTNTNQQNPSGSLFGNNASNTQNKGLFGGSADTQKPGGLFGQNNNTGTNTSAFGGFGSNQNQNQGGGGLFGNLNTNSNQAGSNAFGSSTNTGGGLFGNQNKPAGLGGFGSTQNQGQGNSLFGNTSGNSLFGGSQSQQANQQPQTLHSSLLDGNPYGQSSIWSGLPPATTQNTGPLLTPLSASQRLKERQAQPSFRFTPLSTSKLMTPPKRTGYGFSYSTYGSPSSSNSTPTGGSFANSLSGKQFQGGSFGRAMGKSYSASNLRQQYNADSDSVLAPGAFAPGSSRYSSGSIRRLTIDRGLRTDSLFQSRLALPSPGGAANGTAKNGKEPEPEQQAKLKKRVSFGNDAVAGDQNGSLDSMSGAVVRAESDDNTVTDGSTPPPGTHGVDGAENNEMEQVRSNELQVVPEDREFEDITSKMRLPRDAPAAPDPKPGQYWMEPSREALSKMSKDQLKAFKGFTVGRKQCGRVTFDEAVDLTTVPLDELFNNIVVIEIRSITVYPDTSKKPPQGKGLNVPSTLRIENSWPRNRNRPSPATSGPLFEKHVQRLQRLPGTQFVSYDNQSGVWTFKVPHYTRYALDYEEEEDAEDDSSLTPPPDSPLSGFTPAESAMDLDNADDSSPQDDTFGYKKSLPGTFGRQAMYDVGDHFSADHLADDESESAHSEDDLDMAGSYPPENHLEPVPNPVNDTPEKHMVDLNAGWADHLQRTISPRKQDRQALREVQGRVLIDVDFGDSQKQATTNDFRTSIDLMNSLFGKHEARQKATKKQGSAGKDFEWPYPKRSKQFDPNASDLDASDAAWYKSFKPRWTRTGSLIHARDGGLDTNSSHPWDWSEKLILTGRKRDLGVASLNGGEEEYQSFLASWDNAHVKVTNGVPAASTKKLPFIKYVEHLREKSAVEGVPLDARIFHVTRILFDDYEDQFSLGLTRDQKHQYHHRIVKDRFTSTWKKLIQEQLMLDRKGPHRLEELAIDCLAANDVKGACAALLKGRNFHLATLVSQLEKADGEFKKSIGNQIETWKSQNVISEMTDAIRALYAICAGNTTICDGKPNAPPEDRASTFGISERFELSWMQAFGLYLWYGINEDDPIDTAIAKFASKLASGEESAFPSADFSTTHISSHSDLESPYWVLLKLYMSTTSPQTFTDSSSSSSKVTLPQALSSLSSPFNSRFIFQFHHALAAHLQPNSHLSIDHARAAQLATDFSFQLSAAGYYVGAIFPLLFLREAEEREHAIKTLLTDFAASLPAPQDGDAESLNENEKEKEDWRLLTTVLKIPPSWIYEAKALYARACHDSVAELSCLLSGGHWRAAHECLARRVAPRAVIDDAYESVATALERFGKELRAHADEECPWGSGGGMFGDYIALLSPGTSVGTDTATAATTRDKDKDAGARLRRLTSALLEAGRLRFKGVKNQRPDGGLVAGGGGIEELEERVAIKEMSRRVAGWVMDASARNDGRDHVVPQRDVLTLPLSADARLDVTRGVGGEYYRSVMAAVSQLSPSRAHIASRTVTDAQSNSALSIYRGAVPSTGSHTNDPANVLPPLFNFQVYVTFGPTLAAAPGATADLGERLLRQVLRAGSSSARTHQGYVRLDVYFMPRAGLGEVVEHYRASERAVVEEEREGSRGVGVGSGPLPSYSLDANPFRCVALVVDSEDWEGEDGAGLLYFEPPEELLWHQDREALLGPVGDDGENTATHLPNDSGNFGRVQSRQRQRGTIQIFGRGQKFVHHETDHRRCCHGG